MEPFFTIDNELNKLEHIARVIGDLLIEQTANEWKAQGHNLTGAYINSLEQRVNRFTDSVVLEVYANIYGSYLEGGVPADRIPYGGPSKVNFAGFKVGPTKSAYIQGLIEYVKLRRMTAGGEKKERAIAFAIANKHKEEGMPTKASARFSQTGERTRFIEATLNRNENKINELASKEIEKVLEITLNNIALNYNKPLTL